MVELKVCVWISSDKIRSKSRLDLVVDEHHLCVCVLVCMCGAVEDNGSL